jgi:hypothetical protein
MWMVNDSSHSKLTFRILNSLFSLSPIGWFLLSWFPFGWHLHFSFQIRMSENTPTSHITIHIMKVPQQSTMSVHDVEGKSVVNYPHHEGA